MRPDTETRNPNKGQNAESRSQPGQAQHKPGSTRCEQTRGCSERNESPEKQNPRPPQKAAPLPMSTLYGPLPPHVNTPIFVKTSMNCLSQAAGPRGGEDPGATPLYIPHFIPAIPREPPPPIKSGSRPTARVWPGFRAQLRPFPAPVRRTDAGSTALSSREYCARRRGGRSCW